MNKTTKVVAGSLIAVAAIATGLFASNSTLFKGSTRSPTSFSRPVFCGATATELQLTTSTGSVTTTAPEWKAVKQVKCLEKGKTYFINAGFYSTKAKTNSVALPTETMVKWTSTDSQGLFTNISPEKDGTITPKVYKSIDTHLSVRYAGAGDVTATAMMFGTTFTEGAAQCDATVPQCK